jgi:quinol monooxygenase YgiN
MFSVMIEAQPRKDQWDAYLTRTDVFRPELERAAGFVEAARYKSLTRDGWILSLSDWRDERAVLGWHLRMRDDGDEEQGWNHLLADYRLRFGEVTSDTRLPEGQKIGNRSLGQTDLGQGTYVTLIDVPYTPEWVGPDNPQELALYLGFDLYSYGDCISWDIFEALSTPGEIILAVTWKNAQSATDHAATQIVPDDARVRVIQIVFDEAMSDQRNSHHRTASGGAIAS